jgi:hypothetical protein
MNYGSRTSYNAGVPETRIDRTFLIVIAAIGLVYAALGLTPSSYGIVLERLGAREAGPVLGSPRDIRSDEWAILTPQFQAAVRNGFQRINQTSFYHEDLRNYQPLPLADWSLVFKPQFWAFFILPPANAFSLYFALLMSSFLAGLYLLFREMGVPGEVAIPVTLMVYFSGFCQFWWTTFLPLFATFPWILLLTLRPMAAWKKLAIGLWAFPAFVLAHAYPPLLITLAWGSLFIVLAIRPEIFRSPREMAALAGAGLAAAGVTMFYLRDVIPVMSNTVYPGHRLAPAGTTPVAAVLSQFYPLLNFHLGSFLSLSGENICEGGAVGSFFPLLTICTLRYRELRHHARALWILLAGFIAITLWEVAPVPAWVGHALKWDTSTSTRWLFTSGFLLTAAALWIWRNQLISLDRRRIVLFVVVGPIASIVIKLAWMRAGGTPLASAASASVREIALVAVAVVALSYVRRPALVLAVLALVNVVAFGRFNPLQRAEPIFNVPETETVEQLRAAAEVSPQHTVIDSRYMGSILNGLGFRSINQYLLAPKPDFFRQAFPKMDAARFNLLFNRSGYIQIVDAPQPHLISQYMVGVPAEVVLPIRNIRRIETASLTRNTCEIPLMGEITHAAMQDGKLSVEGWARWRSETAYQGIRIVTPRQFASTRLTTLTRPDIAEMTSDYRFEKAGFKLELVAADGKPLGREDLALIAFGTVDGEARLAGGGTCR